MNPETVVLRVQPLPTTGVVSKPQWFFIAGKVSHQPKRCKTLIIPDLC